VLSNFALTYLNFKMGYVKSGNDGVFNRQFE
jgi:hypothetical protein